MARRDEQDEILKNKISDKIISLRKSHQLTQTGLANLLEIDRQTVFKWEHGEGVTIYSIAKICDALHVTLVDFFTDL